MPHAATGAHLSITAEELFRLRHVARGTAPPSLIIRGGTVLSLHTGELLPRDVVISGRHIAAVDAAGAFVSPGFIDAHIHIEYTKLVPGELARLSVPRGTTTVLADANCIANVLGGKGMDFMGTTTTPLRIFRQVSHKVPMSGPDIELGGASLSTAEICERVSAREAATLGESNPFSLDMASAEKQAAALRAGKRITGHSALLANEPLWAYCAGGIGDDHNAHRPEDVLERLRLGMMLTVMSGSMNSNLETVFGGGGGGDEGGDEGGDWKALYGGDGLRHVSFCADDKLCEDLDATGHIDLHVRRAVELGVPALDAYRMATLNAAAHYRLDHLLGSVTPGKLADLLVIDDLASARPRLVIGNGAVVARDNRPLFANADPVPAFALGTVRLHDAHLDASSYRLYPRGLNVDVDADGTGSKPPPPPVPSEAYVQCVEMYDGYFKRAFCAPLPVSPDPPHAILTVPGGGGGAEQGGGGGDVLKVAVVDRHHASRHRGIAFVRGFGLRSGAIATTTNCENQNLVIVGVDDEAMAAAARAIRDLGGGRGGMVAVSGRGERVLGAVPLDVAGCMRSRPWEEVRDQSLALERVVREELGCTMAHNPFLIASFVGLVAVPDLGLTELGLVVGGGAGGLLDPVLEVEDKVEKVEKEELGRGAARAAAGGGGESVAVRVCCRCPSHRRPS
ncbi:adenine deaminase [Xylariaceae sp. FL0804]|nr:adenine deaminase [Xylariaceae sp. FL0804]